jgi:hypothetical protein
MAASGAEKCRTDDRIVASAGGAGNLEAHRVRSRRWQKYLLRGRLLTLVVVLIKLRDGWLRFQFSGSRFIAAKGLLHMLKSSVGGKPESAAGAHAPAAVTLLLVTYARLQRARSPSAKKP